MYFISVTRYMFPTPTAPLLPLRTPPHSLATINEINK